MSKIWKAMLAFPLVAAIPMSAANAQILGPDAAKCASGDGPALLVKVSGFKNRGGTVRVRTFHGSKPGTWFNKKLALKRVAVPVPDSGPVEVCMAVPSAGGYVVDIRHDANANGDTDRADGAGVSGNPNISLVNFFLGKKPPASQVVVNAGQGVATVPILIKYIQGGAFKPVQTARR
jgi:uncharacterized protein (DUF2141 family)